jgi:hypothetical protein
LGYIDPKGAASLPGVDWVVKTRTKTTCRQCASDSVEEMDLEPLAREPAGIHFARAFIKVQDGCDTLHFHDPPGTRKGRSIPIDNVIRDIRRWQEAPKGC